MIVNHRDANRTTGTRYRMQSQLLVGAVGMVLTAKAVLEIVRMHESGRMPQWFWVACGVSVAFAAVVWLLKSATGPAAAMGGLVCLHVLLRQLLGGTWEETAMPSLLALFLLTFAATRFGRARKEAMGVSEGRRGRRASQVAANLGVAGMLAAGGTSGIGTAGSAVSAAMLAACVAALAEATADTVSSEMGQALGGRTFLITTGGVVPAGTNGGVSVAGTVCGVVAAAVVVGLSSMADDWNAVLGMFGAACAGLVFDSVLGATVERRGWVGNDLVNFASTVFAAGVAWTVMAL